MYNVCAVLSRGVTVSYSDYETLKNSRAKELNFKLYFAYFKIEIAASLMATYSDGRVVSCVFVTSAKQQK